MNIHILSHRRSGSKSLASALERLNPGLKTHKSLSEILHLPFMHEYKFGRSSVEPFGAEVYFHTQAGFDTVPSVNFFPRFGDTLFWEPVAYQYVYSWATAEQLLRDYLQHYEGQGSLVVKTQAGYLHRKGARTAEVLSLFERTILLRPRNFTRWVCSNWCCDHTGIFVNIPRQAEASTSIPKKIPASYVHRLLREDQHLQDLACRTPHLALITEELSTEHTSQLLKTYLGTPDPVVVPKESEYEVLNYETFFTNYQEVEALCLNTSSNKKV